MFPKLAEHLLRAKVAARRLRVPYDRLRRTYLKMVHPHWRGRVQTFGLVVATGVIVLVQSFHPTHNLRVYFYDVGQGDAIHVRTEKGFDLVIDGGPTDRVLEKLDKTLPIQDHTIEFMVLTHPHADHVVGLTAILKKYKVERVLLTGVLHTTDEYREFLEEIKKQGIPVEIAKAHSRIVIASQAKQSHEIATSASGGLAMTQNAFLEILWPQEDLTRKRVKEGKIGEGGGINDTSIVAKLTYGETSFLFMGDATAAVEKELVQACQPQSVISRKAQDEREISRVATGQGVGSLTEARDDEDCRLHADVLKVGHHGSKYSTTGEFLNAVRPTYAAIQVGAGNRYGHPAFPTLWHLAQASVEVFRNDTAGDVIMESDGQHITVVAPQR